MGGRLLRHSRWLIFQFRLLFVSTMTRDGSSADIGDYNTHVQTAAAATTRTSGLQFGFRALAYTAATDAQDNTGTTGVGVPIYWLDGPKVRRTTTISTTAAGAPTLR